MVPAPGDTTSSSSIEVHEFTDPARGLRFNLGYFLPKQVAVWLDSPLAMKAALGDRRNIGSLRECCSQAQIEEGERSLGKELHALHLKDAEAELRAVRESNAMIQKAHDQAKRDRVRQAQLEELRVQSAALRAGN